MKIGSLLSGSSAARRILSQRWLGIVLLTLLALSGVLRNEVIWDDDAYMTRENMASPRGLVRIWTDPAATDTNYYPLTRTTLWLENRLWGHHPMGYHLVNLLLHTASAVLVYFCLRLLRIPGAWFCAAVFAVHPMQVSSVTQIVERKNVLAGFFYFASLLSFLRYYFPRQKEAASAGAGGAQLYRLSIGLFVLSLLSKTAFCTLPLTLLALIWWRQGRILVRDWKLVSPYFLTAFLFGILTVTMERVNVGAQGADYLFSPLERILIAGRALVFYTGKILWPTQLIFVYPRWHIDAAAWWQYLHPLAVVAVLGLLWLGRDRIGRGPLAGTVVFIGNLLPALGFVSFFRMLYSYVADHFVYVSIVGLTVLVVAAGIKLLERLNLDRPELRILLGTAVLAALTLQARQEVRVYHDDLTLFSETIRKNPSCWMAYLNRGVYWKFQGQTDRAYEDYQKARETNPACQTAVIGKACRVVLNNIGILYLRQGKIDQALQEYNKILEVDPRYFPALINRAEVFSRQGRNDLALADYEKAIEIEPETLMTYMKRGDLFLQKGSWDQARADFTKAISLAPKSPSPYTRRALTLMRMGRSDAAIEDLNMVIALDPNNVEAYLNRYLLWFNKKEFRKALVDAKKAQSLGVNLDTTFLEKAVEVGLYP